MDIQCQLLAFIRTTKLYRQQCTYLNLFESADASFQYKETLINDYRDEFNGERGYEIVDDNGHNVYNDNDKYEDDENADDSGDCFGICNILKQLFINR